MSWIARGWKCGIGCGLALAAQGAWADQLFFNRSTRVVSLKVLEARLFGVVLRVQVHKTGKTPKTTIPTVVLEDVKGEQKTFLPDQAGLLQPGEVQIAADNLDAVPAISIPPMGSARFFGARVDKEKRGFNLVTFSLSTPHSTQDLPELKDLNLRVAYGLEIDAGNHATETLSPRRIRQVDGKGAEIPHLLAFEERHPDDDHLTLIDPPKACCDCCVM